MPRDRQPDQAEGLRRLLGSRGLRAVVVTSAHSGAGKTTLAVNLAVALAGAACEVLVFDENAGAGNAGGALGLRVRYELLHVLRGERTLDEVILQGPPGVRVLPAARGVQALVHADPREQARCLASCGHLARPVDVVLIDTADARTSRMLPYGFAVHEAVLVMSRGPAAVMDAYGLIKRLAQRFGAHRFRVVVNRARDEGEAREICANVEAVARRYLGVELDYLGAVPEDAALRQAARLRRSVLEARPEAPATRSVRQLAIRLGAGGGAPTQPGGLGGFMERLLGAARTTPAMC